MPKPLLLFYMLLLFNCSYGQHTGVNNAFINPKGVTIRERILPPKDYKRVSCAEGSFGAYLQQLKLKPDGAVVHYYDGDVKKNDGVYYAVVDMDIGKKDLQQCADVIMHLRADYFYYRHEEDKIHFTLTNGQRVDYSKWKEGYRVKVSGNKTNWVKTAPTSDSYESYRQYMDFIYTYCGTLSLSKELTKISYESMQPGDILIWGGSPGHAELVMDVAQNHEGKKIYLLAQSYMPAQEMQMLINPMNSALSPWYELNPQSPNLITPEWNFKPVQLMRFPD